MELREVLKGLSGQGRCSYRGRYGVEMEAEGKELTESVGDRGCSCSGEEESKGKDSCCEAHICGGYC